MAGAAYTSVSRFASLTEETAWGNGTAADPAVILYPILVGDDGISITQNPGQNILETNTGHGRPYYFNGGVNEVTGSVNTIIDEGCGKNIIEWGSTLASNDLTSYYADIGGGLLGAETNDTYRWTGLKVASMTLTSGSDAGAQRLAAALTLQGKGYSEVDGAAESFANYSPAIGYMHHQGSCTLGTGSGAADTTVRDFSMTFTNNLDVGVGTGTDPQWCVFTGRTVTCDVTIEFASDLMLKAFQSANATAGPTKCTLAMAYNNGTKTLTLDMHSNVVITGFEIQNPLGGRALANVTFTALLDTAEDPDTDFTVTEA